MFDPEVVKLRAPPFRDCQHHYEPWADPIPEHTLWTAKTKSGADATKREVVAALTGEGLVLADVPAGQVADGEGGLAHLLPAHDDGGDAESHKSRQFLGKREKY